MSLKIPRLGLALLVITVVFAAVLTLYLLPKFGGPGISFGSKYMINVAAPDAQALESAGVVLDRGVKIGTVKSVHVSGGQAVATLSIDGRYAPLYRDTVARIGQRTAIGDAYVDIQQGSRGSGALPSNGYVSRVMPNVNFDQAFSTFTRVALAHTTSLINTFGTGAQSAQTPAEWGATVQQLSAVVQNAGGLTAALRDQQSQIGQLVSGAGSAVRELGSRQRSLTSLVTGGRRSLQVFASHPGDFGQTLQRLPGLLDTARKTLSDARPLLTEARPLVTDLRAAAPSLAAASVALRPTAAAARRVVASLPRFNRTAVPFLQQATPVVDEAKPFARSLRPNLENLVPILGYLAPRTQDLTAWFTKTLGGGLQHDSKGQWVRFLIFLDPQTTLGLNRGAQYKNPYPAPGDSANPQPYRAGSYQRLMPFHP